MSKTRRSIAGGVTILGIAGILCKVIGVLFRIPLGRLIGDDGLGVYQLVFPTYSLLLTISSAGLPVAISRMVAHSLSKGDAQGARKVFRVALYMLMALGFAMALAMAAGSGILSRQVGDSQAKLGFIAIAPSVFLVCALSAFRGFLQGQQDMVPTAVSQLIEQVGKILLALPLAALGARHGIAQAAAGALAGTSIMEAVALGYIVAVYLRRSKGLKSSATDAPPVSSLFLMKRLAASAVPITLGACIVPLAGFVDSAMLMNLLLNTGFGQEQARSMYGLYSGLVLTLINVPTALAAALGMSLVPAIAEHFAKGDYAGIKRRAAKGIRFAFLLGLPCSMGLCILSRPILDFFYAGEKFPPDKLALAAQYLTLSSLTVTLFMVVQATGSILQGLRKQRIPMYTLLIGIVVKIALNYVLVSVPSINLSGAPVASLACYAVSLAPNILYVLKYGRMRFDWMGFVVRPALATAVMSIAVYAGREVLPQGRLTTLALVSLGVAVYAGAAMLFKAATLDEIRALKRKGTKAAEEEGIL